MTPITVSLAMAEKLKIAGWAHAGSVHYWCPRLMSEEMVLVHSSAAWVDADAILSDINIAAPTAEEILRKLPMYQCSSSNDGKFTIFVQYGKKSEAINKTMVGDSLSDAAAQMYCHLSTEKLL